MTTQIRTQHDDRLTAPASSSIFVGSLWMIGISLALFFLPLINGVIGGLVGGYKVGGVGRALLAAILPAVVVALGLWIIFIIFDAPALGIIAGLTGAVLVLLADVGIFIGALIGGALSRR
jgi:hypothetical protein